MGLAEVLTIFAIMVANLGTVIALFLHSDKKIEEGRKETNQIIQAIREDMNQFHNAMRDFHGRVCSMEEKSKVK